MAKENKAEKKAAKNEKKAERKANRNPEIIKSIISSVTALACVVAVVVTSSNITNKICDTNKEIASTSSNGAAGNGGAVAGGDAALDITGDDTGVADDMGTTDDTGATVDTAASDDTGAAADTGNSSSSSSGSSSTGSSSAKSGSTDSAPVGSDIAKIVAYYNKAANDTKAYKGKMTLTIVEGASTKITDTSFPKAAMDIANGMLPNDYPTNKSYTVQNGQSTDGRSITKILPIDGNAKMSTLPASGVQSASCTKVSGGYKVVLKLKAENVNSFSKQPANHNACMACLDMTDEDLKPFTCENCNIGYTGGTLTAVINDKGLLTGFDVVNPMHITGTLKWTVVQGTAVIDASWKQTVKFAY